MNAHKKRMVTVLGLLMAAAIVAGIVWNVTHYWMIDFRFYAKDLEIVDLRGREVTTSHYDKVCEKFPGAKIYWNIPFQGNSYDQGNKNLTITTLSEEDILTLDYFTQLETVEASACKDYRNLYDLQQRRPEVKVNYRVEIGGNSYFPDARAIVLTSVSQEEIALLEYLPNLKTVAFGGGENTANAAQLQAYCQERGYDFRIQIGDTGVETSESAVTLIGANEAELNLLQFLPNLKTLHLESPEAPVESLLALRETYGDVDITWSATVAGKSFLSSDTLIDISNIPVTDLSVIEEEMKYFPNAAQLEMNFCGVENEEMAAFREAHREDYKVVWTVYLGSRLPTRTDVDNIMPARDGVSDFHDADTYNMRYCEDVIAIDVGHLDVRNIEFVAFMPKLKYLVISWTGVNDLTPISNCKELVFLEATDAPIGDLTPLKGCTALEDINLSDSGAKNAEVFAEMPWVKNVWAIFRKDLGYVAAQCLPDAYVRTSGDYTVSGWRSIPNYYAMRDALGMFYMRG